MQSAPIHVAESNDHAAALRNETDALGSVLEMLRAEFGAAACVYAAFGEEAFEAASASDDAVVGELREKIADLAFVQSRTADENGLRIDAANGLWLHLTQDDADGGFVFAAMVEAGRTPSVEERQRLLLAAEACGKIAALSQRQVELERVNSRFDSLANSIPGVVYQRIVRPCGEIRYTYISETAGEFFGVSAKEILENPRALFNSYAPEYAESFRKRLIEASKKLTTWDVEASINRPDGTKKYTHAIATPKRQADGSVLWTGVILDASRIKEAERIAAETEERTRLSIVECLGQGFLMFDRSDELVLSNSPYLSLYPQLRDVVKPGVKYSNLIAAEVALAAEHGWGKASLDARFAERLARHRNRDHFVEENRIGENVWVQINEHRTPNGETVVIHTDVSEMRRREEHIHHMALHDALTGLPNRVLFNQRMEEALAEARRFNTSFAILCIDLDNFKSVNDTLGHPMGDRLLCKAADRIKANLRGVDTLARLGGDEFAIVLPSLSSQGDVAAIASRIISAISNPFNLQGQLAMVGASVGIVFGGADTPDSAALLKNADLALYKAKADGKNCFCFFVEEMGKEAKARQSLEVDLRRALDADELELHFQPQIDAKDDMLAGFEALVRWRHPERGLVPPDDFIGMAEETGLIVQVGDWVIRTACEVASQWPDPLRVAVNLSPVQFKRRGLVDFVENTLADTGLPPERLELEITESVLLRKTDETMNTLFRLKELGVRIAMDDFGTGYSSLGNLRSFPFDRIKIDRSFVADIDQRSEAAAIVRAVANLGISLGIETTAEGVETFDQLNYVIAEGCSQIQGYLYGRAVPASELTEIISRFSTPKDQRV